MSSCLSGGGRTYGFDLDIVKSTSTSSRTSHSSSPSSTLSESSNSPITILHRKPRTPRKRPNQTYNEAALLLSTAYPKIFPTKHLTKLCKSSKLYSSFVDEAQELLLPFRTIDNSGFLLHQPILEKRILGLVPKVVDSCERVCHSPQDSDLCGNSLEICDEHQDDFDAESILDEEIEEGIDSIMGNLSVNNDSASDESTSTTCIGYPLGLGFSGNFDYGFGMRGGGVRALRDADESNWWSFPAVDVADITPNFKKTPSAAAQKKKKKVKKIVELKYLDSPPVHNPVAAEEELPMLSGGPRLKLNYDKVSEAWSDRRSTSDIYVGLSTSTSSRKSRSKKVQTISI
ncbi:protein CHLOROPLAST IMPORT APPARATUS 2 [Daucus carota subsp. sativus]|uniref:protein CHLOROPLAST IMPORT APPARATUS 2 n=1 Tax=Daucus carota subsp. sativus TaxID=79200 RepID=UPI0007B27811|nr:PREDICTED: protein CHLOROPLAST IMPORT APPARATUS 2-like [Daucus carota subsp. sativus]XP_017244121.1 PREDICTED: protein CHLOROPLAST IMPORT APPARATUS 2-like [Daucus carota subsp. sativus]XP_017244122.1 PREDICTED: protein CHLOROPLAST IMPORT APPARATUS 2-like [Daucus carota subsp. sativus]